MNDTDPNTNPQYRGSVQTLNFKQKYGFVGTSFIRGNNLNKGDNYYKY